MKNPLKKSKTNSKSKVVVGGKKKQPKSKWKIGYLSIAGLLFFTSISYAGYTGLKAHSLKAKASGYTILWSTNYGAASAQACKTYVPIYGGIYQVKVVFLKNTSSPNYTYGLIGFNGSNGTVTSYQVGSSFYYGFVASQTINVSIPRNDHVGVYMFSGIQTGIGYNTSHPWNWIVNC